MLVDLGEDLGDGLVEIFWDVVAYLAGAIERSCKGRVLFDGDIVLLRLLFDTQRHEIHTFSHYLRCLHPALVVLEGHRIVFRVGYHHVRTRHLRHHTRQAHFAHLLPDGSFDLRISFVEFLLLFDLLFAHLDILFELVLSKKEINHPYRDGEQREAEQHDHRVFDHEVGIVVDSGGGEAKNTFE